MFSVVIPLYNKAPYISRAINSVLNQTYKHFELIVVDDGSTDGSGEIVKNIIDTRIRLIKQKNGGESAARNRGIEEASTEYIAFLDADDEWKPGFLEEIHKLLKNFPNCGAYATGYEIVEKNEHSSYPEILETPVGKHILLNNLFKIFQNGLPFNASSIMVPKFILTEINGFPLGVKRGGDLITWLKISTKNEIAFSNTRLSIYHREAENRVCNTIILDHGFTDKQKFLQDILQSKKFDNNFRKDISDYYAQALLDSAQSAIIYGHPGEAKKFFRNSKSNKKYRLRWITLFLLSLVPHVVIKLLIRNNG